jgi:hypothetical protein
MGSNRGGRKLKESTWGVLVACYLFINLPFEKSDTVIPAGISIQTNGSGTPGVNPLTSAGFSVPRSFSRHRIF